MFLFQSSTRTVSNAIDRYYHDFLEILPKIALGIFIIIAGVLIAAIHYQYL